MTNKHNTPFLTTRSLEPENQESPIHFLNKYKTPASYFYRRNHFPYPNLTQSNFWLTITGQISIPRTFHLHELLSMSSKTLIVPLECAGNKRANFSPPVFGEQWEEGAISQGKWTGVPLRYLLEQVGLQKQNQEVVFTGTDSGNRTDMDGRFYFVRSLPLNKALHPDTLIAYLYNDKPIEYKHGYPLRLIVPNWYGMASVKWLQKIEIINHRYSGPFQTIDYVYYPHKENDQDKTPVTNMKVNSTIQQPLDRSLLNTGTHHIKGIAWTGQGYISDLELSFDKGETWVKANLVKHPYEPYSWSSWTFVWEASKKGEYTIYSRAKDTFGRIQPITPNWNRKGYGYNAFSIIHVKVE